MPDTYTLLEKVVVGAGGASSITFTNIPQTYTDLSIKLSARALQDSSSISLTFNNSTTGYSNIRLFGNGSSAASASNITDALTNTAVVPSTATSNTFSNAEVYIPNYTSSNAKSVSTDGVTENNGTTAFTMFTATLWNNTSAITTVTITPGSGNSFAQHSTFYLYGITKLGVTPLSAPKATGGDIIVSDGTYWYHAFLSSSTFRPLTSLSCDVLVVAGGGAGGGGTFANGNGGGGGGAGGLVHSAAQSLTTIAYTITVGAGGAGAQNFGGNGTNSNMTGGALSLTAAVGGGGGGSEAALNNGYNGRGSNGGSGGGTAQTNALGASGGGQPTSGQGFAGGYHVSGDSCGAGGGGAGGAGGNAPGGNNPGRPGGIGSNAYSTWASVTSTGQSGYYAGGGGGGAYNVSPGGTGGLGGGGDGAINANGSSAMANTGGGGGGSGNQGAARIGGAGGSGIVIVRYAV